MTMARAVREIQRATKDDAIVVTGAGLPQGMVKQRWVTRRPRTHLTSGGFSTMGFTLPAAIGAQLAMPDREVLAVCGDGDFLQTMQELQAAVLAGAPVCTIVLDNSGWISIKGGQQGFFGRSAWTDFLTPDGSIYSPDFRAIGAAFGIHSEAATEPEEVEPAVRRALASGGPSLVHVKVDRDLDWAGPDKTGWWDAPSPREPSRAARPLAPGPGGGAEPMTVASPPSGVVEQAERLRRRLAVGGPLAGAPIGTVPILWNNADLPELRLGAGADAVLDDIARTGYAGTQLGINFPEGDALKGILAARGLRLAEVYAWFEATVDGPVDGSLEQVRERIRLLAGGRRRGPLHRLRRARRSGTHGPDGRTTRGRRA